jgi:hypothetical protein
MAGHGLKHAVDSDAFHAAMIDGTVAQMARPAEHGLGDDVVRT